MVPPDSHAISRVACYLGDKNPSKCISSTGLSPSSAWLPIQFVYAFVPDWLSYGSPILFPLPHICNARMLDTNVFWPIVRFRSPLLTLSLRFLFLRVLRCFTSPGSPPFRDGVRKLRVAPFGYPRLVGYLHLNVAFRSLSRPSSLIHA